MMTRFELIDFFFFFPQCTYVQGNETARARVAIAEHTQSTTQMEPISYANDNEG